MNYSYAITLNKIKYFIRILADKKFCINFVIALMISKNSLHTWNKLLHIYGSHIKLMKKSTYGTHIPFIGEQGFVNSFIRSFLNKIHKYVKVETLENFSTFGHCLYMKLVVSRRSWIYLSLTLILKMKS